MRSLIFAIFLFLLQGNANAQNLMNAHIRKLQGRKTAVFLDKGIFHNGPVKISSMLSSLRHNYDKSRKRERIVFDFSSDQIPKVYGLISQSEKKIYIDFFNTELKGNVKTSGYSRFVESVNFFPWNDGSVSVELTFKEKIFADLFYLNGPGRLVLDVKGSSVL
ncbi:MAG: hypothetical protein E2O68_01070 [Deltaproteobacteria bacterium]|nr:MAG: hypothetical protein E2O68_01070 [Deltaproteobacteria bacterium]